MRPWVSTALLGESRRGMLVRLAIFAAGVGILMWVLPVRKPGEEGNPYHEHRADLDLFERAGVVEFKEGQRGPALALGSSNGRSVTLQDYAGKLVILNFWATWCEPCDAEMPTLESLWQKLRGRGLLVVGINVDRGSPHSILEPYLKGKKLTFPILLDPDMRTTQAWRVSSIPTTFLVKPNGEVAGVAHGAREWDSAEMVGLLETLLPSAPYPAP